MDRVYLDHNATTPMRPEVLELLVEHSRASLGNPSSLHASGRRARDVVDRARERVASSLGVSEDEILFTSGGTESNNLALFGALGGAPGVATGKAGLITTAVEHSSVLEPARALERAGRPLELLGVDRRGRLDLTLLEREGPLGLVSVMAANNETGMLAPLHEIGPLLAGRAVFHTDGVQALGKVPVDLAGWGVDLASFSAHKLGGPQGVGVLWCRRGVDLTPLTFGGGQERALRPGTEPVANIAAAALAIELAVKEQMEFSQRTGELTRAFWNELELSLPGVQLLGPLFDDVGGRLPNTLNVSIPHAEGRVLVTQLDLEGLEASAGSACASGSLEPSHVLLAMGCNESEARAALRLSVGRTTTRAECKRAVDILRKLFSASRAT